MMVNRCTLYLQSLLILYLRLCRISTAFNPTIPMVVPMQPFQYPVLNTCMNGAPIADVDAITDDLRPEDEEEAFFQNTKILCSQRNLPFKSIKNARDLATVRNSPIHPNRILRTGRVSDATDEDLNSLYGRITSPTEKNDLDGSFSVGIRTLVDLRSPTELKDDLALENEEVYGDFVNLIWSERKGGAVRELNGNEPRIPISREKDLRKKRNRSVLRHAQDLVRFCLKKDRNTTTKDNDEMTSVSDQVVFLTAAADIAARSVISDQNEDDLIVQESQSNRDSIYLIEEDEDGGDETEDCCSDEDISSTTSSSNCRFIREFPPGTISLPAMSISRGSRKERHFVSLMNELKYVRGTLSKLRKRDIARVLFQSPGAIVSRRVRANCKDVFLDEINEGGLVMLNELILKMGKSGIKYVLDLCADTNRHPIAFYCTAGKDRTGIIALLILSVLGVSDDDIIEDYSLSANVYAEMNDHKAMVGALQQRNVDPKTFLGAPPHVMKDTLLAIRNNYGSVDGYLDSIGFGNEQRLKLRKALL